MIIMMMMMMMRLSDNLLFEGTASSSTSTKSAKLEHLLEKEVPKSRHPFVTESVPENHEIYCSGNNTLMHLNISCEEMQKHDEETFHF